MTISKTAWLTMLLFLLSFALLLGNACDDDDDDNDDNDDDDDSVDDDDDDDDDIDDDDDDDDDDDTTDDDDDDAFVDNGDGTASDGATGLMWQLVPDENVMTWNDAVAHCEALTLAGHDDWRMPTLDELRSVVRGCPVTMPGGDCPTDDECTNWDCWDSICTGCDLHMGPGADGCYWPDPFAGACEAYWSSIILDGGKSAWMLYFKKAGIHSLTTSDTNLARCVR